MTPPTPRRRRWTEHFITGLLILAPAYLTAQIVWFLLGQISRLFSPVFRWLDPYLTSAWADVLVHVAAVFVFIVGVAMIGWGMRILIVRRIFGAIEDRLVHMPMVGKIYAAIRDIARAFGGERKTAFSRVVLVEWPGKGRYAIGFVTHDGADGLPATMPEHVVHVLIPHTPNPTSGFLILADRASLIPLEMSVEDGFKLVISGGVVGPTVQTPAGHGRR